ncbi:MAG: polysaccharide deacetylase family protein [Anaerolineae bacterium]|nr:polysaccharide deacetylase family protein [Anaerolineae bacterium]
MALARNAAVVRKYQTQGIEFAIHGYRHIDHSQLSVEEQNAHFQKAIQIFAEEGIDCKGFRCPYLRWNEATLAALSQNGLAYDSSNSLVWAIDQRHCTDSYYRALEFYGAQPASDYLALPKFNAGQNLVRIPYCLPDDESLIERLIWDSPAEMNQVWPTMFQEIHQRGELFNLGLHPERTYDCADSLEATMRQVQAVATEVWRAPLKEIATWWKNRYQAEVEITDVETNKFRLTVNGPPGATVLLRSVESHTATKPWFDGYQQAVESPCLIQTNKRPFIGISPASSPDLTSFLKQQGYIVEISSQADLYPFYLDRPTFSPEQEQPLDAEINRGSFPLVRLGRWPNGAKSAFCVTGDIDAITVWDYGLRFVGY